MACLLLDANSSKLNKWINSVSCPLRICNMILDQVGLDKHLGAQAYLLVISKGGLKPLLQRHKIDSFSLPSWLYLYLVLPVSNKM